MGVLEGAKHPQTKVCLLSGEHLCSVKHFSQSDMSVNFLNAKANQKIHPLPLKNITNVQQKV